MISEDPRVIAKVMLIKWPLSGNKPVGNITVNELQSLLENLINEKGREHSEVQEMRNLVNLVSLPSFEGRPELTVYDRLKLIVDDPLLASEVKVTLWH